MPCTRVAPLESEDQSGFDRQGSERETLHLVKTSHIFDCDGSNDGWQQDATEPFWSRAESEFLLSHNFPYAQLRGRLQRRYCEDALKLGWLQEVPAHEFSVGTSPT